MANSNMFNLTSTTKMLIFTRLRIRCFRACYSGPLTARNSPGSPSNEDQPAGTGMLSDIENSPGVSLRQASFKTTAWLNGSCPCRPVISS
jgi:hypothetical protein